LQSIFKAKIKEKSDFVAVQNFEQKGAPNIVRYQCGKAPEGYNFVIIHNNEEEATYKENIEYTTFDGLQMVHPDIPDPNITIGGTTYEIVVPPGQKKMVLIKASVEGFSSAARMSTSVFHGDRKLREMCLEAGERT
jgi:hypothetical protein